MRFGIIGCGEIGGLRARAVRAVGGCRVAAVADPIAVRREAVARSVDGRAYADVGALLADRQVDAVIVSTPAANHRDHVLAALGSGRPVLCEKPLATNGEACEEMVSEADRRALALATGFNIRHFPAFARAKQLLDEGAIGDLDFVRAYHGHPGGREFSHPTVHVREASGGGTLMDNGIHLLDLVRFFLGEVAEVNGMCTQGVWHFPGCEDNGFALFKSVAGRAATLQSSWTEWRGYGFFIEAYGTRGFVRASYPPMLLTVGQARAPGEPPRPKRQWFPLFQIRERLQSYRWTIVQSFVREIEDFVAAVGARRPPLCSGRDGLHAVQLAEAIYRSAATGESITLQKAR